MSKTFHGLGKEHGFLKFVGSLRKVGFLWRFSFETTTEVWSPFGDSSFCWGKCNELTGQKTDLVGSLVLGNRFDEWLLVEG